MKDEYVEHRALGAFNPHYRQLRAVAKLVGTDLGEAVHEGHLTEADHAAVITRCRGANCLQLCVDWLADKGNSRGQSPEFCANRAVFEHLRNRR
jgi:hypothetical protein